MNKEQKNKTIYTLIIFIFIGLINSEDVQDNLEEKVKQLDEEFDKKLDSKITWLNQLKIALKKKMEEPTVQSNYEHYSLLESKENKINSKINELTNKKQDLAHQPTDLDDYYKLNEFRDRTIDVSDIQNDEELKKLIIQLPKEQAQSKVKIKAVTNNEQKVTDFGGQEDPYEDIAKKVNVYKVIDQQQKNDKEQSKEQPKEDDKKQPKEDDKQQPKEDDKKQSKEEDKDQTLQIKEKNKILPVKEQQSKEEDKEQSKELNQDQSLQIKEENKIVPVEEQSEEDDNKIQEMQFSPSNNNFENIINEVPKFNTTTQEQVVNDEENIVQNQDKKISQKQKPKEQQKPKEVKVDQTKLLLTKYKLEQPKKKQIDTSKLDETEQEKVQKINKEYEYKNKEITNIYTTKLNNFVKKQNDYDKQVQTKQNEREKIHSKYSQFLDKNFGEQVKSDHIFINGEANGVQEVDDQKEKKQIKVKQEIIVLNTQQVQEVNKQVNKIEKRIEPKQGINIAMIIPEEEEVPKVNNLSSQEKKILEDEKTRIEKLKNDPDFQEAMIKMGDIKNNIEQTKLDKSKEENKMSELNNKTEQDLQELEEDRQDKIFNLFSEQEQKILRKKQEEELQSELKNLTEKQKKLSEKQKLIAESQKKQLEKQRQEDSNLQSIKDQALQERTDNKKIVYPDDADLYNIFQIKKPSDLIDLGQSYNVDLQRRRLKQNHLQRLRNLIDYSYVKNSHKEIEKTIINGVKDFVNQIENSVVNLFETDNKNKDDSDNNSQDEQQKQSDSNSLQKVYQITNDPNATIVYEIQLTPQDNQQMIEEYDNDEEDLDDQENNDLIDEQENNDLDDEQEDFEEDDDLDDDLDDELDNDQDDQEDDDEVDNDEDNLDDNQEDDEDYNTLDDIETEIDLNTGDIVEDELQKDEITNDDETQNTQDIIKGYTLDNMNNSNENNLQNNEIVYEYQPETQQEQQYINNLIEQLENDIKQEEKIISKMDGINTYKPLRKLEMKKGRPYLKFSDQTKKRIQNLLLNISQCIQNKDIKQNAAGVIDQLQKNLYQLKNKETLKYANQMDKLKDLLIQGRAIDSDKTKDYLREIKQNINTILYESMKKKNINVDDKNLLYTQNVLKNLIEEMNNNKLGKGILLEDIQNLLKVAEMKSSQLIQNIKKMKNISQTDSQFLLKRIKDKMDKDIDESDPQKNEVIIESIAQNIDAFITNEVQQDYQSITPKQSMENFINKSIKSLENLKDSKSQSGYKFTTQEIEGLVNDVISEIKNEENAKFKKRLDSLHYVLLKIDNDLTDLDVPDLQKQNMINTIYSEFEKYYSKIINTAKDISNSQSPIDETQFVQKPENKPYYQGFKVYADKVIDYTKNLKRTFRSIALDDFVQDLFGSNKNLSPNRRLINSILFDYEKNKHNMNSKEKLGYFMATHYLQQHERSLNNIQHEQAVMTVVDKDENNKKKMVVIKS